jgi:hypothetical protein
MAALANDKRITSATQEKYIGFEVVVIQSIEIWRFVA